jgi:hypothetical protein
MPFLPFPPPPAPPQSFAPDAFILLRLDEPPVWTPGGLPLENAMKTIVGNIAEHFDVDWWLSRDGARRWRRLAGERRDGPDVTVRLVPLPGVDAHRMATFLRGVPGVAGAYVVPRIAEPMPDEDPQHEATDVEPDLALQEYLEGSPVGIGARDVWHLPGGRGQGVRFADVERGWHLGHQEFEGRPVELVYGDHYDGAIEHGTAMAGIVVAGLNDLGTAGIVAEVDRVVLASSHTVDSSARGGTLDRVGDAILAALDELEAGDVCLLEMQFHNVWCDDGEVRNGIPAEAFPDLFEIIRLGTDRGIVMVSPAGNGDEAGTTYLLDEVQVDGHVALDPAHPDYRDSGSILVAASRAKRNDRLYKSNYGTRVNCFAWGNGVHAPSAGRQVDGRYPRDAYDEASGTSSASAIIAGVAALAQALHKAAHGKPMAPDDLRALLADPEYGTPPVEDDPHLGVMPGLGQMVGPLTGGSPSSGT